MTKTKSAVFEFKSWSDFFEKKKFTPPSKLLDIVLSGCKIVDVHFHFNDVKAFEKSYINSNDFENKILDLSNFYYCIERVASTINRLSMLLFSFESSVISFINSKYMNVRDLIMFKLHVNDFYDELYEEKVVNRFKYSVAPDRAYSNIEDLFNYTLYHLEKIIYKKSNDVFCSGKIKNSFLCEKVSLEDIASVSKAVKALIDRSEIIVYVYGVNYNWAKGTFVDCFDQKVYSKPEKYFKNANVNKRNPIDFSDGFIFVYKPLYRQADNSNSRLLKDDLAALSIIGDFDNYVFTLETIVSLCREYVSSLNKMIKR